MNKILNTLKKLIEKKSKNETVVKHDFLERSVRIKLQPAHKISFEIENGINFHELNMLNISSSGIAFSLDSFLSVPLPNSAIYGHLVVDGKEFPVELRVVHTTLKVAGCKITDMDNECRMRIAQYFFHELLAAKLYPINPDKLKADPDGEQVYLTGEDHCELHYVKNNGALIKFSLSIMGNYIEVDKNKNIYVGRISEDEACGDMKHKGPNLIHKTRVLEANVKVNVINFISSVEEIPNAYRKEMIALIKKSA